MSVKISRVKIASLQKSQRSIRTIVVKIVKVVASRYVLGRPENGGFVLLRRPILYSTHAYLHFLAIFLVLTSGIK